MPRRRLIVLAAIAIPALILIGTVIRTAWWYTRFREQLRLADEHAPIVRRTLEAEGRFSDIRVESFTGLNGSLLVHAVAPPGATSELKRLVEATSPPVTVKYEITSSAPATHPAN